LRDEWLDRVLAGETAPNIALMQLFTNAETEAVARQALLAAIRAAESNPQSAARLREMKSLWDNSPGAYSITSQIHRAADIPALASGPERTRQIRDLFDRAASISAEAGVALYSLGNRDLLDSITTEIVMLMRYWKLFDQSSLLLEIGCGAGRFLRALAPHVRGIIGLDISELMLHRAVEQGRHFSNLLTVRTGGADLASLADNAFDAVLAIDSFPYIVDSGAAQAYFGDCARILKTRGRMLVMNFDYSAELQTQRAAIGEMSAKHGFTVLLNGTTDLHLWDGKTFLLEKHDDMAAAT
jgi:SAM-dependent methyltransferase